jgi:predicted peptidase
MKRSTSGLIVGNRRKNIFWFLCCAVAALLTFCSTPGCAAQQQSALPGVVKQEPPFRNRAFATKSGARMPYRLFIPPGYDSGKQYPLVMWFHGGSGRGSDDESQIAGENEKGAHLWTTPERQAAFPAFVLAPQCPKNENWSDPDLNEINTQLQMALDILTGVQKDYSIDADRIYLVGQAMGGLAVWTLLQNFPEQWAAAVVVASYDNFTNPRGIARVPLWIFQSDMDRIVPVGLVREMVKQLNKSGGAPRYTEYHKLKGEVWDRAFDDPALPKWVSMQRKSQRPQVALNNGRTPTL